MMRWALVFLWPLAAAGDTLPRLTVEGGLAAGTASAMKPLAYSEALQIYLVERNDQRPNGSERSWNFY